VVETKEAEEEPPSSPAPAAMESFRIAPSPTVPVSQDHPASGGSWYIQVGAFGNFDNAHRLALSLQNAGYPVKLVPRDTAKGKLLQVRVGGYATRTDLAPVAEALKEKFHVPTAFVTE
jgi:cell division septation protein DedD